MTCGLYVTPEWRRRQFRPHTHPVQHMAARRPHAMPRESSRGNIVLSRRGDDMPRMSGARLFAQMMEGYGVTHI